MHTKQPLNPDMLNNNGLNLQFVCNIAELPPNLIEQLAEQVDDLNSYNQLILIGHGGRQLWESLTESTTSTTHNAIDNFTLGVVSTWVTTVNLSNSHRVIYPTKQSVNLIGLGKLAGWHHESPFKVGINKAWGPWFAYRAVILADSHFPVTQPSPAPSPCSSCKGKICIDSCPADACSETGLDIGRCISYRKTTNSICSNTCLARINCPVQVQHRYTDAQINYHYTESMKLINHYNL